MFDSLDIENISRVIAARAATLDQVLTPDDGLASQGSSEQPPATECPILEERVSHQRIVPQRDDHGWFVRFTIGVFGFSESADLVFRALKSRLAKAHDALLTHANVGARYDVTLFGGQAGATTLTANGLEALADQMVGVAPNILLLVDLGDDPDQLMILTGRINEAAYARRQRPFTPVLVGGQALDESSLERYIRSCLAHRIRPAVTQFATDAVDELICYLRFELKRYAQDHLQPI